MSTPVTRAGVIAAGGGLSLVALWSEPITAGLFLLFGLVALGLPAHWAVFERIARPAELNSGRLVGVAGFAFASAVLAVAVTLDVLGFSPVVFVMTILIVGGALFGEAVAATSTDRSLLRYAALCTLGAGVGVGGYLIGRGTVGSTMSVAGALYLAGTGGLATGLVRDVVEDGEDPSLIIGVGALLGLFGLIGVQVSTAYVLAALGLATALGVMAFVVGIASIAGMLSGILLGVITLVYGGLAWFVVLLTFYAVGGLATKYRYSDKSERGVAEDDRGARGSRNVLGNSLIAMIAVVGQAGSPLVAELEAPLFEVLFAGAIATALADTLSSEIGCLYDEPILITNLDRVRPGTNGAVTVQGSVAGIGGAGAIAGLTIVAFPELGLWLGLAVAVGGGVGMFADSFFGATLEDVFVGNEAVNVLATLVGAVVAAVVLVVAG